MARFHPRIPTQKRQDVFWSLVFTALFSALCFASPVFAAYTIDPLRLEVTVPETGNIGTTSVRIQNIGDEAIRLKAYLQNWTLDEGGGLQLLEGTTTAEDIAEKVRFNPKEFEVLPKSTQVVRLAVTLPPDSKAGEYRGMLFFEDLKTESQRLKAVKGYGASVEIKQRFGIAMYVYKGAPQPKPALVAFDCFVEKGKLKTQINLENQGKKHARMTGSLLVMKKDAQGALTPVEEIPINDLHEIIVLPGQNRRIAQLMSPTPDKPAIPPGSYQVDLHLKPSNPKDGAGINASTQLDLPELTSTESLP